MLTVQNSYLNTLQLLKLSLRNENVIYKIPPNTPDETII